MACHAAAYQLEINEDSRGEVYTAKVVPIRGEANAEKERKVS